MGIITRLYHRSESLADNRFNVFFLDMGENIHIHYRDLRIELSTDEFLEFSELFATYAPLAKSEVEKGYRDGVHPNTNQSNTLVTISNKKPLKHAIRYNPNRISIEENLDGYHIHLRNYKLLLDKQSFTSLVRAARDIVEKRESSIDIDEAIDLIEINELPNHVSERSRVGSKEQAVVIVEKPYFRKTQQLLEGLKYEKTGQSTDSVTYEKEQDQICLRQGHLPKSLSGKVDTPFVPLFEYIKKNATKFTPEAINLLKLQYLDVSQYVGSNKLGKQVDLNYRNLIYDTSEQRIIFPSKICGEPLDANKEYDQFMTFLKDQGLSFVKPAKIPYTELESERLRAEFHNYVNNTLAKTPCVSKVYLFNAESKKRSGCYQVPFVHFNWAKLGSDFDLLIEIDERYPVPKEWLFKFFWKACSSDYYLLGDINYPIESPFKNQFKHVHFYNHLVEAYLFFGSKGNPAIKNEYLKKHNAKLLYQKTNGRPADQTEEQVHASLLHNYGIEPTVIEKLDVVSFNEFFRVTTDKNMYAAKLMKKEDFTPAATGHSGKHLEYEAHLLESISQLDLPVSLPVPGKDGRFLQQLDNRFCMLFPFIVSDKMEIGSRSQLQAAAETLAAVHQAFAKVDVPGDWYRFNEVLEYWTNQFSTLFEKFSENDKDAEQFGSLTQGMRNAGKKILEAEGLPWVHSHGDVCPRNFFYINDRAILFDFQVAHYGPRIEDIAEGALEFSLTSNGAEQGLIDEFITSYDTANTLTPQELELLPTMLFLQSTFKLARAFRVQILFGYKVSQQRVKALQSYALSHQDRS